MRYDDASQASSTATDSAPVARPDVDLVPAGSPGPASGNVITGEGTVTGNAGADTVADAPGAIVEVHGAGGPTTGGAGSFQASGQYGVLNMDGQGNFSYVANAGTPPGAADVFSYTLADADGATSSTTLTFNLGSAAAAAAVQGMVNLPAGVEMSDIKVSGRDLIITMPDGTQMVIPGGAVFVPQLVIGDVQVPPSNLAALLIDSEAPKTGSSALQSSGGNFEVPVPPLDPGVPLGDLIPPTQLAFTPPEVRELFDALDTEPEVTIQPEGQLASVAAVDEVREAGLPTRNGGEPEGSGEEAAAGPNGDPSEATTGEIHFTAEDGLDSLTIQGAGAPVAITSGSVGTVIHGAQGDLTITAVNLDAGTVSYSYVLLDNTNPGGNGISDPFTVVVEDSDHDVAIATLRIDIVDDVPDARDDTDAVVTGTSSTDGNVMTSVGTTNNPAGKDTVGADNATVTGAHSVGTTTFTSVTAAGVIIPGQFGNLLLHSDGSYVYNRTGDAGGTEVFTYRLTDGDGDTDDATLTITVAPDLRPTVTVPTAGQAGTSVDEKGLPAHFGRPEGTGEAANPAPNTDQSEITSGTITYTPGDNPAAVTINGVAVVAGANFAGDYGTLHIDSFDTVAHTITYTYTLNNNVDHDTDATPFETFTVRVEDVDHDVAQSNLIINIVDDVPIANDDTDSVTEDDFVSEGPPVAAGNVITGVGSDGDPAGADFKDADDSVVTLVDGLNPGVGSVTADADGEIIVGQYGTLFIKSDGSYIYTLNNSLPAVQALSIGDTLQEQFQYTLLDNDGDTDTAILTITINGSDDIPTVDVPTGREPGTQVSEVGLPPRSGEPAGTGEISDGDPNNESDDSEITTGTITYTDGDGPTTITIQGVGGPVTVAVGANIQGAHGVMHIDAFDTALHTITYTYTLQDNVDHDSQPGNDQFQVVVSDSDGSSADDAVATLTINIANDAPIAADDTDSVVEGQSTAGNVLTGFGGDGNPAGADIPGADDFAPTTVVAVTSLNPGGGSDTDASANFSVAGQYGTLILNAATGAYTYQAFADTDPPVGAKDVFSYTVIDNDGNTDTATLTIDVIDDLTPIANQPALVIVDDDDVGVNGNPGIPAVNDDVPQNASGTLTSSSGDGEVDIFFDLAAIAASLPAGPPGQAFTLDGASTATQVLINQNGVRVLTVTLTQNPGGTANYTVVQNAPIHHADGNLENNTDFNLAFFAQDADTDKSLNQNLTIRVDDDSPTIVSDTEVVPVLVTDDTDTPGDSASASFAGLFTGRFGADGPKDSDHNGIEDADALRFSLSINGGDGTPSGLIDVISGDAILLRVNGDGDIEGYVSSSPGTIAFLIDLNKDTGSITLTQNRAITHNDPSDPLETFASGSAAHMASGLVVLTATIEDSDADTASATANIGASFQFEDDGPSIDRSANPVPTLITDDTDTPGDTASASFASLFTAGSFGKDGFKDSDDNNVEDADAIRYSLSITGGDATPSGLIDTLTGDAILLRVNGSGDIEGYLSSAPGTIAFLIDLNLDTGSVQLTQNRAVVHNDPNDSAETFASGSAAHMASGLIVLTATIEDGDGDTDTATANIGDAFQFEDDGPTAAVSTAGFSISHDETPGIQGDAQDDSNAHPEFAGVTNTGDDPDVLPNGAGSIIGYATSSGVISSTGSSFGKDGFKDADDNDVADSDATVFSLNISNPLGTDSGLNVTDGSDIILFKEGDLIVGRVSGGTFDGKAAFAIAINASTGQITMVQYLSIQHSDPTSLDESASITPGAILATVTVTDGDGDKSSASTGIGNLISFQDDGPTAVVASAITTGLDNGGNDTQSASLNIGTGQFGADGGKVIFTNATITTLDGENLKHGGTELTYVISNGGQTLDGFVDANTNGVLDGGDTAVFTIVLQPGGTGNYQVTMHTNIDSVTNVNFNDGSYDFVGGNDTWAGFVPLLQVEGKSGNTPVNDDSKDLLLTPIGTGTAVNGNANSAGTSGPIAGQNIGNGEGMRLDFVEDLSGIPTPGTYSDPGEANHDFDQHYNVNGVVLKFGDGTSTLTTASFKAFTVSPLVIDDNGDDGTADPVAGTGTLISVTSIAIIYDGETATATFDPLHPTDPIVLTNVGNPGGLADRTYTVTFVQDAGGEYYATVQGIYDTNVRIATFGETDYNALEVLHLGPSDADADFAITGFGAAVSTTAPVDFTVPISVIDGDGDTVSSGNLAIHASAPTPPVVLDLNGDGVHFLSADAGVAYDYGNGSVATAWASPEDGILVRDDNGNGTVDGSHEFVFGGNGLTDLQALAAQYGSALDANDADFGKFAVWQDANSNGVADAGEVNSLTALGISSISLSSDGISYQAANDDVSVAGTGSYTNADGSTGLLADATFSTGARAAEDQLKSSTAMVSNAALIGAIAAAGLAASEPLAAHDFSSAQGLDTAAQHTQAFAPVALDAVNGSGGLDLADIADGDRSVPDAATLGSASDSDEGALLKGGLDATGGQADGHAPDALPGGTDAPAPDAPSFTDAGIAMPDAGALIAAQANGAVAGDASSVGVQHNAIVAQVLVDALQGGGSGPNVDALINSLPTQADQSLSAIDALASHGAAAVSNVDMGAFAGFTADASHIMNAAMHPDAAPAAV